MLVIFLLLMLACVSSGHYHESDVYHEEEGYHDMSDSLLKRYKLYNNAERQKNDRAYERAVNENTNDNIVEKNNEIEDAILRIHRRRKKHNLHVHKIQMPNVAPSKMDTYLCVSYKLPKDERYIVKYEPAAEMQIAHHMLLYSCEVPFKKKGYWKCREMQPECEDGKQSIVYAWGKNAPPLTMPKDVGFRVGGDSGFKYLVLQVHYLHVSKFKDGVTTDKSGVKFTLDKRKKKYLAGIYCLADGWAPIPPHKKKTYIDMGCLYTKGPKLIPFRFRVHAHKLGVVITGYRVRNDKWTLIGRGDPQRPQAFYKIKHHMNIKPGDTLAGRCTYDSTSRNKTTLIGATHADEMCNFYIMYYYDPQKYDVVDELQCGFVNPKHLHYPKNSDVSLAIMENSNRMKHSGVRLVL